MHNKLDLCHTLKIKVADECPNRESVVEYYSSIANKVSYEGDCGVDLIFPEDVYFRVDTVTKIGLGIQCEMNTPNVKMIETLENMTCVRVSKNSNKGEGYMLVPRSSISSTPLCMANSIGIIDQGYRGEIIVPIRCFRDVNHSSTIIEDNYSVKQHQRLFQIVAFDGKPIRIEVVTELSKTKRGESGFGSTDITTNINATNFNTTTNS